jgi:opacity protein-like surface antigen
MKKIMVAALLSAGVSGVFAQDYVGALVALTKIREGCVAGATSCGNKPLGFKVYAGAKYSDADSWNIGIGRIDTLEVGAVQFGSRVNSWPTTIRVLQGSTVVQRVATAKSSVSARAMYFAGGAHIPLISDLTFTPKLGVAWVSTTARNWVNDVSEGSETQNHLAPYVSLGLEYAPMQKVKVEASVDFTHAKTKGVSATAQLIGVGAAVEF